MAVTCSTCGGRHGHQRSGKEELLPGSPSFGRNAELESIEISLETGFDECIGDFATVKTLKHIGAAKMLMIREIITREMSLSTSSHAILVRLALEARKPLISAQPRTLAKLTLYGKVGVVSDPLSKGSV